MGYSIVENDCMSQNYLEDFCSVAPYVFLNAEEELARMGDGAIPVLLTFFAGSARNSAGVPYRAVSARAMRCAFATVCRLGAAAKPLEGILRAELKDGDLMCADALFALGSLEEKTIDVLPAFAIRQVTLPGKLHMGSFDVGLKTTRHLLRPALSLLTTIR